MKVELRRLNDGVHFEALNENGNKIEFDAQPATDGLGEGKGFSPMQAVLGALAGCSVFDIVTILKKQRQDLKDIRVIATGERAKDVTPKPFTEMHLHFKLYGNLEENKVSRAVELSVEKYCSVGAMLEKSAKITHSFELINE